MVPRTMSSTNSACLSTFFGIKGHNYSISSACSTSAHCIGNAMEAIQLGKQDVMFAGGGEELHWTMSVLSWQATWVAPWGSTRSEEHTSELQSLMRISYAVFCLKKNT